MAKRPHDTKVRSIAYAILLSMKFDRTLNLQADVSFSADNIEPYNPQLRMPNKDSIRMDSRLILLKKRECRMQIESAENLHPETH